MAANGSNGVEHTYALSETHKNVNSFWTVYFAHALTHTLFRCWRNPFLKVTQKLRPLWYVK
jgi:hypothetical protein